MAHTVTGDERRYEKYRIDMGKRLIYIIIALVLAVVAAAAYLTSTFRAAPGGDRPTLVFFHADF